MRSMTGYGRGSAQIDGRQMTVELKSVNHRFLDVAFRMPRSLSFLEEEARFFDCQFIIATHSPFLLSLRGAKIYDFDGDPVDVKRWTQLNSVKAYFEFFEAHRREFRQSSPSKQEK